VDADVNNQSKALAALLKLGTQADFHYSCLSKSGGKQWSLKTPSNRVALLLYNIVKSYWNKAQIWPHWHRVLNPKVKGIPACLLNPQWCDLVENLEPMNRQNCIQWFEAGEPFLTHLYGEKFEKHKMFAAQKCYQPGGRASYSLNMDPGKLIQDAIKKDLRQSFRSMAK
jgi:hypothetical protein